MCFVKMSWALFIQVFLVMACLGLGFVSCTTSDNDNDAIEKELNAEMGDLEDGLEDGGEDGDGDDISDADFADIEKTEDDGSAPDDFDTESSEDVAIESETEAAGVGGDEDFEDDEFLAEDSPSPADGSATAAASDEDDDFLAEEKPATAKADEPAAPAGAGAGTSTPLTAATNDDLAEGDLEKEMNKDASMVGSTKPAEQPFPDVSGPMDPPATGASTSTASVNPGTITSKESFPTADSFEQITSDGPSLPKEDLGQADPLVAEIDPPLPSERAAAEVVPVSKIEKHPFYVNERLMNTVYITRPSEDMVGVSQKIFGEDKTGMLFADNPHINDKKGFEVGDKVYYNSPNRADDRKTVMTYYEDNKMAPMYYVTRQGDDIQKIGRQVLGFDDGWREVWAINESLQSQAMLPAGLKLRYWSGNEVQKLDQPSQTFADATANQPMTVVQEQPPEVPIDLPAPDPSTLASEDPGLRINTEPAPLPSDTLSPTPSMDSPGAKEEKSSSLMTVAGGAIVILAILALVAIQIKNRKRMDPGVPPSLEFTKV